MPGRPVTGLRSSPSDAASQPVLARSSKERTHSVVLHPTRAKVRNGHRALPRGNAPPSPAPAAAPFRPAPPAGAPITAVRGLTASQWFAHKGHELTPLSSEDAVHGRGLSCTLFSSTCHTE